MHSVFILALAGAVAVTARPAAPVMKRGDPGYGLTEEYRMERRDVSDSQYWHERYHGILSMAAYGDYETLCPQTFSYQELQKSYPGSTESPWLILDQWGPTNSGMEGFNVIIPEMDKVVMVFKGIYGWQNLFNHTAVNLNNDLKIGAKCANCTAHQGALQAYLEAKDATNDWATVKQAVQNTGHQWSVTGHGFGGMVAQIAALDLGWRGLCHWSHNHGSPRVFNAPAANLYNQLFQGEAGQRTVANNDMYPNIIPESPDYTHTLQGFHVFGQNKTYGMTYNICNDVHDPECLGGNSTLDHDFYYTSIGMCGKPSYFYNETLQQSFRDGELSSWNADHSGTPITQAIPIPTAYAASMASASSASVLNASMASVASASASSASVASLSSISSESSASAASASASASEAAAASASSTADATAQPTASSDNASATSTSSSPSGNNILRNSSGVRPLLPSYTSAYVTMSLLLLAIIAL